MAVVAHDGLARAINPVHTMSDGDSLFALGTGQSGKSLGMMTLCTLAAEAVAVATARAILLAHSVEVANQPRLPSACDMGCADAGSQTWAAMRVNCPLASSLSRMRRVMLCVLPSSAVNRNRLCCGLTQVSCVRSCWRSLRSSTQVPSDHCTAVSDTDLLGSGVGIASISGIAAGIGCVCGKDGACSTDTVAPSGSGWRGSTPPLSSACCCKLPMRAASAAISASERPTLCKPRARRRCNLGAKAISLAVSCAAWADTLHSRLGTKAG